MASRTERYRKGSQSLSTRENTRYTGVEGSDPEKKLTLINKR